MEWKRPPLHRHLSTIGIGPVFICPPPHNLPQQPTGESYDTKDEADTSNSPSAQGTEIIDTWEIVGDIKVYPEDFLVREIGWAPDHSSDSDELSRRCDMPNGTSKYRRLPGWTRAIAGLDFHSQSEKVSDEDARINDTTDENVSKDCTSTRKTTVATASSPLSMVHIDTELSSTCDNSTITDSVNVALDLAKQSLMTAKNCAKPDREATTLQNEQDGRDTVEESPLNGLRRILTRCYTKTDDCESKNEHIVAPGAAANDIMQQIAHLQQSVIQALDSAESIRDYKHDIVWIPTVQITQKQHPGTTENDQDDWKRLHQYTRLSFPLLKTEASSVGPSRNDNKEHISRDVDHAKSWIRVIVDETFFSIAPLLAIPSKDLIQLYMFRNKGPVAASGANRSATRFCGGSRRNQGKPQHNLNQKDESIDENGSGKVLLRLKPDLPRSERRVIHQALASNRRRDFDTSTKNNVPLHENNDSVKTTAIVVQWSRNALQGLQKKRKRNDGTKQPSLVSAIFCVLRKEQCEHQVAINKLSHALKCRIGDIGLAGIKDMQAITYQFCTLRNVGFKKVLNANSLLHPRVRLSHFQQVNGQDALLDRGRLLGNRFEITLRNMKRLKRSQNKDETSWKEQMVPVSSSHLDAMTARISQHGFINFYGEQRVGDPGCEDHVGVRAFDVGKAMLKEDYPIAIDLIMTGRSSQVYNPSPEEIETRAVWKKTKDARQTLAKFPKSMSTMTRERDIMKGMLRYGNALEAIRCVHHNMRMFWIHAYQSYIWNKVATERVKLGLFPVIGDLYLTSDDRDDVNTSDVRVVCDPETVHISQVVLPLPGYNVQYPENEIGDLYKTILTEDGIDLSKNKVPESTAKGSYRKLLQKADGLHWEPVGKSEDSDDPVVSDVKFTFELESGAYATMMLRELMVTTMSRDSKSEL